MNYSICIQIIEHLLTSHVICSFKHDLIHNNVQQIILNLEHIKQNLILEEIDWHDYEAAIREQVYQIIMKQNSIRIAYTKLQELEETLMILQIHPNLSKKDVCDINLICVCLSHFSKLLNQLVNLEMKQILTILILNDNQKKETVIENFNHLLRSIKINYSYFLGFNSINGFSNNIQLTFLDEMVLV